MTDLGPYQPNIVLYDDCLSVMKQLPGDSIPLIVVDPPYGIGYHSNHYKDRNPHAPIAGDWNFQLDLFLVEAARVLMPAGAMYLFTRWDVAPVWWPVIQRQFSLKVKTAIAWVKDNWSAGDLKGCFGNQYEQLLFIVKGRHLLRGKRWPNVWTFPRVPPSRMLMPAQKPVALLRRAIEASSDAGDIVADFFCGSGSTGVAALECGRRFLMADIDKKMVAMAKKRLGLPVSEVDQQASIAPSSYEVACPDWSDFGIHPEELAQLAGQMRGNGDLLFSRETNTYGQTSCSAIPIKERK